MIQIICSFPRVLNLSCYPELEEKVAVKYLGWVDMNTFLFVGIVLLYIISMVWVTRSWKLKLAKLKRTLTQTYEQELVLEQEQSQALKQQVEQQAVELNTALHQSQSESQVLARNIELKNAEIERLTQACQTLSSREREAQKAIAKLTTNLTEKDAQTQALSQELDEAQVQRQALQEKLVKKIAECQGLTQDLEMSLDEIEDREQTIQATKANNQDLSRQIAHLQQEVIYLKFAESDHGAAGVLRASDNKSSADQPGLAQTLFQYLATSPSKSSLQRRLSQELSNLDLARNSIDEIMAVSHDGEKFTSLMNTLQTLNDGNVGELKGHKKVNATKRRWSECRVPHVDLLRIYFQKVGQERRYQVLVASKADSKTQAQDVAWLKNHIAS